MGTVFKQFIGVSTFKVQLVLKSLQNGTILMKQNKPNNLLKYMSYTNFFLLWDKGSSSICCAMRVISCNFQTTYTRCSVFSKHYSSGPAELVFGGKSTGVKGLIMIFDSGSSYTYFNSQAYQAIVNLVRETKQIIEPSFTSSSLCAKPDH